MRLDGADRTSERARDCRLGEIGDVAQHHDLALATREIVQRAVQIDPYNAVSHYHLATLYRQLGRTEDSRRELAAFQKVKEAKERLKDVYKEMRLQPAKPDRADPAIPK